MFHLGLMQSLVVVQWRADRQWTHRWAVIFLITSCQQLYDTHARDIFYYLLLRQSFFDLLIYYRAQQVCDGNSAYIGNLIMLTTDFVLINNGNSVRSDNYVLNYVCKTGMASVLLSFFILIMM